MKSKKSQQGLSIMSWLVVLIIAGFFVSIAFKMVPHYVDYMAVNRAILVVETDKALGVSTISEFYEHMAKQFQVNGVRGIDIKKAIKVEQIEDEFNVQLDYERREPLINNLFLVAQFKKEYRLRP